MTASLEAIRLGVLRPIGMTQHLSSASVAAATGFSVDQFIGTTAGIVSAAAAGVGVWLALRANSRNIRASAAQESQATLERGRMEERRVWEIRVEGLQREIERLKWEVERRERELDTFRDWRFRPPEDPR